MHDADLAAFNEALQAIQAAVSCLTLGTLARRQPAPRPLLARRAHRRRPRALPSHPHRPAQIAGKCGGQNCLNVTNLPPGQRNAAAGGEACADQSTLTGLRDCENVTKWDPTAPSE